MAFGKNYYDEENVQYWKEESDGINDVDTEYDEYQELPKNHIGSDHYIELEYQDMYSDWCSEEDEEEY